MANYQINITKNGKCTLTTAEKYCDRDIEINVNVGGSGDSTRENALLERTITSYENGEVTVIGQYGFSYCQNLIRANLPNVTDVQTYAFNCCSALTTLNLPKLVTLSAKVFTTCKALTTIYIPASCTTISGSSYYNSPFYLSNENLQIYCEAASKPSGWGTYWNYYQSGVALPTTWGVTPEQYQEIING